MTDKYVLKITTPKYGELNIRAEGVSPAELNIMPIPEIMIDGLIDKVTILQKKLDKAMERLNIYHLAAKDANETHFATLLERDIKQIEDIKD